MESATSSFKHLVDHFIQAIDDFPEKGRDREDAEENHEHGEGDLEAAEEKLQCALKDIRRAVKDFSSALKDLEQIEEVSEQIAEWADEAGNKEVTAELVRLYIKEQASSQAAPKPLPTKDEKTLIGPKGRLLRKGNSVTRASQARCDPFRLTA